jgi:hypothetical protein
MDPIVLIGNLSTTWSYLSETTDIIRDYPPLVPEDLRDWFESGWEQLFALDRIRSWSDNHRGLYWCLVISQHAIATDPHDKVYGLLGLCNFQVTEPITAEYLKSLQHVLAEATVISILEECAFPYLDPKIQPVGAFAKRVYGSSWVIDFPSMPRSYDFDAVFNSELGMEERERRRGSVHLSADCQTLYVYGRYVGTVCETQHQPGSWHSIHKSDHHHIPGTAIYAFYHSVLKARGITPRTLSHTLRMNNPNDDEDTDYFDSLLHGSKDMFHHPLCNEGGHRVLLVTEEGHLGISFHTDPASYIPVDSILVCLFVTAVPFILAPVAGAQSYEMINVAYVLGYGDQILDAPYLYSSHDTWIDFAAEGGREYAII